MVPDSFYDLRAHERFAMLLLVDSKSTDEQRETACKRIKAMSYSEFLKTEYWQVVRNYVVQQAEHKCQSCLEDRASEVHHRSYKHHGEEHLYLADLEALCRECHEIKQEKFDNVPAPDDVAKGTMAQAIRDAANTLSQPFVANVKRDLWYEERRASEEFSRKVYGEVVSFKTTVPESDAMAAAAKRRNPLRADMLATQMASRLMEGGPALTDVTDQEPTPGRRFKPITQADVDKAVSEHRDRAARAQLGEDVDEMVMAMRQSAMRGEDI